MSSLFISLLLLFHVIWESPECEWINSNSSITSQCICKWTLLRRYNTTGL